MMMRVFAYEWTKWRSRGDCLYLALCLLLAAPLYGLALQSIIKSGLLSGQLLALAGAEGTGFNLAFHVTRDLLFMLGIIILIWSSTSFAGERENNTLRLSLLRVSRFAVSRGKAFFLLTVMVALSLGVLVLALLLAAWAFGLNDIVVGGLTLHSVSSLIVSGLVATSLTLLPLCAFLSLGLFVSSFARSAQSGLTISFVLTAILWVLGQIPDLGSYFFTSTLNWPFSVALSQSEGLKTLTYRSDLVPHVALNLVWIVALLLLASAIFRKRDQA